MLGSVGSGKTTLVNHILTKQHGARIAVISKEESKEPGAIGMEEGEEGVLANNEQEGEEGVLANNEQEGSEQDFVEMPNGCIRCTPREVGRRDGSFPRRARDVIFA